MEVDYIVVGAGASGCVLASRLAEDPGVRVLLLEAGGGDHHPLHRVPKAFLRTMASPRYAQHYRTSPPAGGAPPETWVRGRGIGGSTTINGTMYVRGDPADYDELAASGNPGWEWSAVRRAFVAMEDHELGPSPWRGAGGRLPVAVTPVEDPIGRAAVAAAETLGVPAVDDVNAVTGERVGPTPSTIRRGQRVSAARAFLDGPQRRNLTIERRAHVGRLLFDGSRVTGVRVRHGRSVIDHRARREVVVAAGAIESPLLLQRSGVGPADVLTRAGVPIRVDHPNVGRRLVEQRGIGMKARLHEQVVGAVRLDRRSTQLRVGWQYLRSRTGVLGLGAYELTALLSTAGDRTRPDAQVLFTPVATDDSGRAPAAYIGCTLQGYGLRPTTESTVELSGPDPSDPPRIEARYLESDTDRQVAAGVLDRMRQLLATSPLAELIDAEVLPGPDVADQEAVVAHALASGTGIYHAVGSCAMGPGRDDVVDAECRVRGLEGVRVVDASVFPTMPSGGTAAPTMAAAWLIAEALR